MESGITFIGFGSEMVGAVRGIDPATGRYSDDTKRHIDAPPILPNNATRYTRAMRTASSRGSMPY